MFLFTKKTKNIVKWFWIVFASLIIISMIVAYSGFSSLSRAPTSQPQELTPEMLAQIEAQLNSTTSPELPTDLDQAQASGTVEFAQPTIEREEGDMPQKVPTPNTPPAPSVPKLEFEI